MVYTFDNDTVSDLHKDAYGFRPSRGWWSGWNGMDAANRQAEWDRLVRAADDSATEEANAEAAAKVRWDAHITQLMLDNDIDKATATRWDMQAMGANGDEGYYCYLWGIGYANEASIKHMLETKVLIAA